MVSRKLLLHFGHSPPRGGASQSFQFSVSSRLNGYQISPGPSEASDASAMTTRSGERPHRPLAIVPNDDAGWLGREPTVDEQEVVAWMRRRRIPARILHVGVGTGFLSREFGSSVSQGLTKDGGEARHARTFGLEAVVCNKYDVASYSSSLYDPFDCIVDVNIRSYACCDDHFREYMDRMMNALTASGMLLTSRSGLEYLVPTSVEELRRLCRDWTIRTNGNVVVMRPRLLLRVRKRWLARKEQRQARVPA